MRNSQYAIHSSYCSSVRMPWPALMDSEQCQTRSLPWSFIHAPFIDERDFICYNSKEIDRKGMYEYGDR